MSWRGKCPQRPISSLCDFYISPWRVRLSQWWCDVWHCHTQCVRTFHWPAYRSTGTGTFLSLALQNEVRKSIREREIHHYLSVLCACGCDFSFFQPPFFKRLDLSRSHGFVTATLISLFAISAVQVTHKQKRLVVHHIFAHGKQHSSVSYNVSFKVGVH